MWQLIGYVVSVTLKFVGLSTLVTAVTTNLYGNYYFYQLANKKTTNKLKYKEL